MRSRAGWFVVSLGFALLLVQGWQMVADARLVSPVFLPGPDRVWRALHDGMARGALPRRLGYTVERMFAGWLIASLLGIALGSLIGLSRNAREWLQPMLEFLRPLPASAMIPFGIALFGLSDAMVLAVIAFGALWPMLLSTIHGFAAVEPRLYEVARALRLSRAHVVWKIALPNAMPDILAGMRLGLTVSLILAVVGEMLGGRDGLGYWILLSARSFHSADLFAGIVLLGAVGYVTAQMLTWTERVLLRWQTPT